MSMPRTSAGTGSGRGTLVHSLSSAQLTQSPQTSLDTGIGTAQSNQYNQNNPYSQNNQNNMYNQNSQYNQNNQSLQNRISDILTGPSGNTLGAGGNNSRNATNSANGATAGYGLQIEEIFPPFSASSAGPNHSTNPVTI